MADFNVFLPIAKVDKEKRTVSGYASTPTKDSDGEIITLEAIKAALPDYMAYGNIREMHKLNAVGIAEEANIDTKGLYLTARIVDQGAWEKCLEGVYKGFSIGGRKLDKVGNKITELEMTEISVVDRPANPDCRISLAKSAKAIDGDGGYLVKLKGRISPEKRALAKMAKIVGDLAKAGPPAAQDGFSLPAKTQESEPSPNDARDNEDKTRKGDDSMGLCEKHQKENCALCAVEKAQESKAKSEPYGDVNYADSGLQSDGQKRYPIDTEEHIRAAWNYINKPKNAAKYSSADAEKVKAKIVAAWKSKVDPAGPPSLSTKKLRKLAKAQHRANLLQALIKADTSFVLSTSEQTTNSEGKVEEPEFLNLKKAKESSSLASEFSPLTNERTNFMSELDSGSGDPIAEALATLMKRAAMPTKAQRMMMAEDNAKKSRKAMKGAREAIEEAHKMHKAAYLSKAAKKKDETPEEFDHAGAMEKLQKAYQELDKARTFNKAVSAQLEKMARSGQRGEEVSDGEGKFYEVPEGVKSLSPDDLATASPGGAERGSMPPMYPVDGSVYAGKAARGGDMAKYAKNGQISAEVAELIMEKARMEGEVEALRRIPAGAVGGQRPYAFDMNKMMGGAGGRNANLSKSLFDGVNVAAINGQDERAHVEESAKVIGNLITSGQFGKSVFDPAFKGAAGNGKG